MDTDAQLKNILGQYNQLLAEGREQEARSFVLSEFPKLPQDLKEQLLGEVLTSAMQDKVEAREAVREMNEEGIEAFKALDQIELDIKKSRNATS